MMKHRLEHSFEIERLHEDGSCMVADEYFVSRLYAENDSIWQLPEEKRKRKLLADVQRALLTEADKLAQTPYTIRG